MGNVAIKKNEIQNRVFAIIQEMTGIKVGSADKCLFDLENNLSAEFFVYILLRIKDDFNIVIDDNFVLSLTSYSLNNIVDSIIKYSSNNYDNIW